MNVIPKKIKRDFDNMETPQETPPEDDSDVHSEDLVVKLPISKQDVDAYNARANGKPEPNEEIKDTKSDLSSSMPVKNEDLFNVEEQKTPKPSKGKKKKVLSEKQRKHMERIRALALKKRQEKRRIREEAKSIKQKEKEARLLAKKKQREEQLKNDKLLIERKNREREEKIKAESEAKRKEQLKLYEEKFEDYFEKRYQQRRAKEREAEREIKKEKKAKKKVLKQKVQKANIEEPAPRRRAGKPRIRLCPYTGRLIYS
tara:strand:+ start:392 stop:1165 length:774 start_codon:yes stop_codon:yes gene_type:complete